MSKKEREICEFQIDLNNLCLRPNLSNDKSENGCGLLHFLV